MAGDEGGDMLMFLVQAPGTAPLPAESTSSIEGPYEKLMQGFRAGCYFEVEDFTFSIELQDDEGVVNDEDSGSYARWRGMKPNEPKPNPPFKAEPADVSIKRQIDKSSPAVLEACLARKPFHQVVLVKRARKGSTGRLAAVLRMQFDNVWFKAVEWDDGDAVSETYKFKYSAVTITYVDRKADGTPGTEWPCGWKGLANA